MNPTYSKYAGVLDKRPVRVTQFVLGLRVLGSPLPRPVRRRGRPFTFAAARRAASTPAAVEISPVVSQLIILLMMACAFARRALRLVAPPVALLRVVPLSLWSLATLGGACCSGTDEGGAVSETSAAGVRLMISTLLLESTTWSASAPSVDASVPKTDAAS